METSLKGVTVFLDRDGTLNHDSGYITSPDGLMLLPGVVEAVARANRTGARVVLVTNQSGVARGFLTTDVLVRIHHKLENLLRDGGGKLDGLFFCPHHPEQGCWCRKPNPGLLEQAKTTLGVDLSRSYVVGDKAIDIQLAQNVGAVGILVTTSPYGQDALQAIRKGTITAEFVASNLSDAVDWIIQDAKCRNWSQKIGIGKEGACEV